MDLLLPEHSQIIFSFLNDFDLFLLTETCNRFYFELQNKKKRFPNRTYIYKNLFLFQWARNHGYREIQNFFYLPVAFLYSNDVDLLDYLYSTRHSKNCELYLFYQKWDT